MANVRQLKDHGAPIFPITHVSLVKGMEYRALMDATYAWDGTGTPDVSKIPAGVVVTYDGTDYTGTLVASASTTGRFYLVPSTTVQGEWDRYMTDGSGSSYAWKAAGNTSIPSPAVVDNETTDDPTKPHSAAGGKRLKDQLGELEAKVGGLTYIPGEYCGYTTKEILQDPTRARSKLIKVNKGDTVLWHYGSPANTDMCLFCYNGNGERVNYWANNVANERTISNIMSSGSESVYYISASFLLSKKDDARVYVNGALAWRAEQEGLSIELKNTESKLAPFVVDSEYVKYTDLSKYSIDESGKIANTGSALHTNKYYPISQETLLHEEITIKSTVARTDGYSWYCRVLYYNYAFELIGQRQRTSLPITLRTSNFTPVENTPIHGNKPAYFRFDLWLYSSGVQKASITANDFIENDIKVEGLQSVGIVVAKAGNAREGECFDTQNFADALVGAYTLSVAGNTGLNKEMQFSSDTALIVPMHKESGPMLLSCVLRRTNKNVVPVISVTVNNMLQHTPISVLNDYHELHEYRIPPNVFHEGQVQITIPANTAFCRFSIRPEQGENKKSKILFASHLGALYGKNSIPAFEAASQMGFRACVANLRTTADGVLVCAHNNSFVAATDDQTYNISEKTLSEINELGFYETRNNYEGEPTQKFWYFWFGGQEIVTAERFLQICRNAGMRPIFSCHQFGVNWLTLKAISDRYGFIGDDALIIKSFDEEIIYEAKAVFSNSAVYYLDGYETGVVDTRKWTNAKIEAFHEQMSGTIHGIESEGAITDEHIQYALSLGIPFGVGIDTTTEEYHTYANKGASMFTSDRMFSDGLNW